MQVSLNWLKDYLTKSDGINDPHQLNEKLTMRGLSVARVSRCGTSGLDSVIVGRIEKIDKHPNADRLSITQVCTETGGELRQIVCGAKNITVGDIVPVALPGALLPGNFEIKISTIRGVESMGMLCSGTELGISKDSDGILQLPKHSQLGTSLSRLLGSQSDDTLLEFELTPNRGDCLSVMGIAREVASLIDSKLRELKPAKFKSTPHRTSSIISVEVPDPVVCPRYIARVIDGFKVLESPDWIQARLKSVGQRAVNNIVDITNFVMLEYGAPLHAFDLRRIQSGTVRVASCTIPQDFTLLSGQIVQLEVGDILIQDGDRPIALAGIMGGLNTQVEPDTTTILLEAATFNPSQIRKTAKRLGLLTESSRRFEKGVDPNTVLLASERAAVLLRDAYSANVYHPPIDTLETGSVENTIAVDMREVRRILGIKNFEADTALETLSKIGIVSTKKSQNIILVKIPTFRVDLKESIDVIEEIARLYGYDQLPLNYPITNATFNRSAESNYQFGRRAKFHLMNMGLRECIHYSFLSDATLQKYAREEKDSVSLKNPISDQFRTLRTSLIPSLLTSYSYNRNRQMLTQRLFEVGNVYLGGQSQATESAKSSETGVVETAMAAGLISGPFHDESWTKTSEPANFFHAKAIVETLTQGLSTATLTFVKAAMHPAFHPNRSSEIMVGSLTLGIVGEIHPHIVQQLEAPSPIIAFEINLELLQKYEKSAVRYMTPSKFPTVDLDIAVVVDQSVCAQSLLDIVRQSASKLLRDARIFDVYEGDKIPAGKKSIAIRLVFGSPERTLSDNDTKGIYNDVIRALTEKFAAVLRS